MIRSDLRAGKAPEYKDGQTGRMQDWAVLRSIREARTARIVTQQAQKVM